MGKVVDVTVKDTIGAGDSSARPQAMPYPYRDARNRIVQELCRPPEGMPHARDRRWLEHLRQDAEQRGATLLPDIYLPIIPVGWRLALLPLKVEELSDGGIALPETVQRNNAILEYRGVVIAMGNRCYQDPKFQEQPWCQLGDIVCYLPYESATYNVNLGGKMSRYIIINDADVRGVITDPAVLKTYV